MMQNNTIYQSYGVLDLVLAGSSGGVSLDAARLLDCNLGD